MATTSTAGAIIVAATALLVALVAAQAPASAPGPSITTAGVPGPSMTTAGAPGPSMTTAGAPGPGGLDCLSSLANLSDCLSYVQEGSNLTTPDKACCPELAGLVESQPICLCQLLGSNTSGFQIDFQKALKLPSVCSVQTPPASLCSVAGYPIGVPMPSEAPSTPGGLSPEAGSPKNGAPRSGIANVSQLLGLAIAFLTTLVF
ncbi:hypothetical protein Vadar_031161 [Vaccinium darrowii]|uniref:Uncharacterized protein n=1 Tax=Vaccinium darrowii TaxID=229202 RepID=A0ACB7XEH7_9ERIC|nr:hypothetical protein Vadar_031161 [Vaccinium darrowii]